ncbi:MAG TPA: tetratricopeptide repeat protein [Caulobacteraceae bacterium]|nr:tetratricopeptide repeat protein [Caulobacteraceae bacterium]
MPFDTIIEGNFTGASTFARNRFEQALWCYQCFAGDPLALLEEATEDSPGFVMAHVLKANLLSCGSNPDAMGMAAQIHALAAELPMTRQERGHVEALGRFLAGEFKAAGRILEDVSIDHPTDLLALQSGQLVDFMVGDSRMIRDRIARAMPHWSRSMPGYHAMLAMHAFGLEETGLYARAEAAGRESIELEPRNSWAQHAVAHVLEMQGRRRDGIVWMREDIGRWDHDNFFKVHNWWHLALFHLGLDEVDEVLEIYDRHVFGEPSDMAFDMVDASALLWRLIVHGVDVGERWGPIADAWEKVASVNGYAFSDAHAVMAFVGARRKDAIGEVIEAQRIALSSPGDNAEFVAAVGADLVDGLIAFGSGDYSVAADRLRTVRNRSNRFGGSNAQRDLIDLTLIAAAERGGEKRLAQALIDERRLAHPSFGAEADLLIV